MLTGHAADKFLFWAASQKNDRDINQYNVSDLDEVCLIALQAEFANTLQFKGKPMFDNFFDMFWRHKTKEFNYQGITKVALEMVNTIINSIHRNETNR